MATLGMLDVAINANTSGLTSGISGAMSSLTALGTRAGAAGVAIGAVTAAAAAAGAAVLAMGAAFAKVSVAGTQDAMKYESAINQLGVTLGDSAGKAVAWSNDQAAAFGLSRLEAVKYAATFANLIKSMESDTARAAGMTTDMLEAMSLIGQGTGRTMEDVGERIRSGLLGSTEAIEDLGINVNVAMLEATDAFRRFAGDSSWQKLDFQTQQQIRYFAILEQATAKYGGIAESTSFGLAKISTYFKDAALSVGQGFLPALQAITPAMEVVGRLALYAADAFKALMFVLFGVESSTKSFATQTAALGGASGTSLGGMADSANKAGGAVKKLGKEMSQIGKNVQGFDEFNLLTKDMASGAGGSGGAGSGGGIGGVDAGGSGSEAATGEGLTGKFDGLIEKVERFAAPLLAMRDAVMRTWEAWKPLLVQDWDNLKESLGRLGERFERFAELPSVKHLAESIAELGTNILLATASAVMRGLTSLIDGLTWLSNQSAIKQAVITGIEWTARAIDWLNSSFETFRATGSGNPLRNAMDLLVPPLAAVKVGWWLLKSATLAAWDTLGGIYNWLSTKFGPYFTKLGEFATDAFAAIWDGVSTFGQWSWDKMVELYDWMSGTFAPVWATVSTAATEGMVALWMTVSNNATFAWDKLTGLYNWMSDTFALVWSTVSTAASEGMGAIWATVSTNATLAWDKMVELYNWMSGTFAPVWATVSTAASTAFGTLATAVTTVWDGIATTIKTSINGIIQTINKFTAHLATIKINIPKVSIPGFGEVGGGSVGFPSIPKIPELANGGIIGQDAIYRAGEGNRQEAVIPLQGAGGNMLVNMMREALSGLQGGQLAGAGGGGDIVLMLNDRELARAVSAAQDIENSRRGRSRIVRLSRQ